MKKCNQCDFASSDSRYLRKHLKSHSGEKSNKCNECDSTSIRVNNLRRHLKRTAEKSKKCNQWDFAYSDPSYLSKHLKSHSGEKSNKCNKQQTGGGEQHNGINFPGAGSKIV